MSRKELEKRVQAIFDAAELIEKYNSMENELNMGNPPIVWEVRDGKNVRVYDV